MHPFNLITQTQPSRTKAYKWASAILGYEASRRSDERRFDREYNLEPKTPQKAVLGLQGRSLRPPLWKLFNKSNWFNLLP